MARNPEGLDTFLAAYIEAALWSSTNDTEDGDMGPPLDDDFGPDDLTRAAVRECRRDCKAFLIEHAADIGYRFAKAGHDFWLTRNGHGAGFWDGDWPEPAATRLTDAAHVYGSVYLYVHRKRVHVQ